MNNTGCILTELAGLLCTPEQVLQMPLASDLRRMLCSAPGIGWDGTEWMWPGESTWGQTPALAWALPVTWTHHSLFRSL